MSETNALTLWQALDRLARQIPFTREKVETALATTLLLQESRLQKDHYGSQPISLADGIFLQNVDLRLDRASESPGFLSLSVGGACISRSLVKRHYPNVRLTYGPHIDAPGEAYVYTAGFSWGDLHFAFELRNPQCLATISFNTARFQRNPLENLR